MVSAIILTQTLLVDCLVTPLAARAAVRLSQLSPIIAINGRDTYTDTGTHTDTILTPTPTPTLTPTPTPTPVPALA